MPLSRAVRAPAGMALGAFVMMSLITASLAGAQETDKEPVKKEGWETSINAGLNLTRGNSKTMMLNGGVLSEYKKSADELRMEIQGSYGENSVTESDGTSAEKTSLQNAKGTAEYKRLMDERNYAYLNGELMHDYMAGIDYRLIVGPGLGRYFLKSGTQALSAEAGVAYVRQRMSGNINNTVNLRVAQHYEVKPLAGSKIWESIEFLPAFNDFDNYFINFEVGAEAAMTTSLSLRVVLQDQFNNRPDRDKEKNNLQLIAGVTYKL